MRGIGFTTETRRTQRSTGEYVRLLPVKGKILEIDRSEEEIYRKGAKDAKKTGNRANAAYCQLS